MLAEARPPFKGDAITLMKGPTREEIETAHQQRRETGPKAVRVKFKTERGNEISASILEIEPQSGGIFRLKGYGSMKLPIVTEEADKGFAENLYNALYDPEHGGTLWRVTNLMGWRGG